MTFRTLRHFSTLGFVALGFFLGCGSQVDGLGSSDSKTNWMMACEKDAECGTDLACVCGVCTQSCETTSQCAALSTDAVCVLDDACADSTMFCEPAPGSMKGSGGGSSSSTGGTDGSGGASSSGGAASSGGDNSGGAASGGSGGALGECGCVAQELSWGPNGGLTAYMDTSTLTPCGAFVFERSPLDTDPVSESCEVERQDCEGVVNPASIQEAVMHADVQAAIAVAPVLYGRDNRPVDMPLFRMDIGGSVVDVGEPCDTCTIPAGVSQLADLLKEMTREMLEDPACATIIE